jgi:hypothetical protein
MRQHTTQSAGLFGRKFLHDDDLGTAAPNQICKGLGIGSPIHQISRNYAKMGSHPASDCALQTSRMIRTGI